MDSQQLVNSELVTIEQCVRALIGCRAPKNGQKTEIVNVMQERSLALPILRVCCGGDVRKASRLGLARQSLCDLDALKLLPRPSLVRQVFVSENCLTELDVDLLTGVEILNASTNKLRSVKGLSVCSQLRSLDLSENADLSSKLGCLGGLTRLARLRLCGIPAVVIPQPLLGLQSITHLALARCALKQLPALSGLRNLAELDVSCNALLSLGRSLAGLVRLSLLNASHNGISDWSGAAQLPALALLDARHNAAAPELPPREGLQVLWENEKKEEEKEEEQKKKKKSKKKKRKIEGVAAVQSADAPVAEAHSEKESTKKPETAEEPKKEKKKAKTKQKKQKKKRKKVESVVDEAALASVLAQKSFDAW